MKRTIIVASALLIMSLGAALTPAQADHNFSHHSGSILVEDTVAAHPGWWEMGADVDIDLAEEDPGALVSADIGGEDPPMVRWIEIKGASGIYEVSIASQGAVIGGMDVFEHFSKEGSTYSVTPDCPRDLATRALPGEDEGTGSYLDRILRLAVVNHQTTLPGGTVSDEATALLPARDGGYLVAVYVRAGVQGSQLDYEVSVDTGDNLEVRNIPPFLQPQAAFGLPYDTFTWVNNAGPCAAEILEEHPPPEPAASMLPELGEEGPSIDDLLAARIGDGQALEVPSTLAHPANHPGPAQGQPDCVQSGATEEGFLRLGSSLSESTTVAETLLLEPLDRFVVAPAQHQLNGLDAYILDLRCDDLVGAQISVDTDQPDLRVATDYQLGLRFYDRAGFETGPQHLEDVGEDPIGVAIPDDTQFVAIWASQCSPAVDLTPIGQVCIRFETTVVH